MAWTPQCPSEPRADRWWHDVWIYQQEAAVADARRAERIERLHAGVHKLDMQLAGVQSRDRWNRIQRWFDRRDAHSHGSQQVGSLGAGRGIEDWLMATTNFREDYVGRNLQTPTSNALDYLGRATTATVDGLGRSRRRVLRANTTAVPR